MRLADIIVVDSLFLAFPSAMGTDFSGTARLNDFYGWCKRKGKTAIVVDHQGKKGDTPFGSMGKDIGLDAVLQLIGEKQDKTVKIMKCRNFSTHSDSWKKFRIRETEDRIFFEGIICLLLSNPMRKNFRRLTRRVLWTTPAGKSLIMSRNILSSRRKK